MSVALGNPLAHAYGSVEEQFVTGINQARICDTINQGNWPILLRALTIPLSDAVFTERSDSVEYRGALKVANLLVERLRVLEMYPQLLEGQL